MPSKRQETSSMQQFWVTFVVSCWFYLSLFRSRFRTFFLLRLHLAVVPSNETKDNVKWPLPPPSPGIPSPRVWPLRFKIQMSFAETQPSTTSSIAELRCFCWTWLMAVRAFIARPGKPPKQWSSLNNNITYNCPEFGGAAVILMRFIGKKVGLETCRPPRARNLLFEFFRYRTSSLRAVPRMGRWSVWCGYQLFRCRYWRCGERFFFCDKFFLLL